MVTFKFTLKSTPNTNGEHSIIILLIKDRINTSLSIRKKCQYNDWSFETERLKKSHKDYKQINTLISKYTDRINEIVNAFEISETPFILQDIITQFKKDSGKQKTISFTSFHEMIIEEAKKAGKISTANIEKETLSSLQRFFDKKEISFRDLSIDNIYRYQSFLNSINNSQSTIGIRMRTLRAIFNKAIKREIIPETIYPFKNFKVSKIKESGKKEYLTELELEKLKSISLEIKNESIARDMFLLSFYGRGINFVDLMLLEKTNLHKGTISYRRRKTGVMVSFKVNDFWQKKMVEFSSTSNSIYLFNIMNDEQPTENYIENRKEKFLKKYINTPLKNVLKELEISKNITYYCARHSFATILKFNNISIDIIKEALGHKDIKSTMSYLNTLPSNTLDKMIDDVINF